jgi:hypothetical protein
MSPAAEAKGRFEKLADFCDAKSWMTKKVTLYFVCPVTFEFPGEGYDLTLPEDWLIKYGPALRIGLSFLKVACVAGRLSGLPIPNINDLNITEWFDDNKFLSNVLDEVTSAMNEKGLDDVTKLVDKGLEIGTTLIDKTSEECTVILGLPEAQKAVRQSYAEIKEIAVKVDDREFLESGLIKAIGPGPKFSIEYVAPRVKRLYEEKGEKCIGLSAKKLSRMIQEQFNLDKNADLANVQDAEETEIGGVGEPALANVQDAEETEIGGVGEPALANVQDAEETVGGAGEPALANVQDAEETVGGAGEPALANVQDAEETVGGAGEPAPSKGKFRLWKCLKKKKN